MPSLADFDYHLPEDRIALHPASPRDSARLLVVRPGEVPALADHVFTDLPDQLSPGDLLVFNDTRVIPARLEGIRLREESSVRIEVLLVRRIDDCTWDAFARPGKRLRPGDRVTFGEAGRVCLMGSLSAEIVAKGEEGIVTLRFERTGAHLDEAIAAIGAMPLPPYILEARRRAGTDGGNKDHRDYQTVFARVEGSVAAPTAALHFTPDLIERLTRRGIGHVFVTLHVGAGTFLPVKAERIEDHRMHAEWGEVSAEAARRINAARAAGGRIVAVGTTACRLIESAAGAEGTLAPFLGETAIFIRPGHVFRATDALITNFHLPRSTLMMLVSAFAGLPVMRSAYAHAIAAGYRFYSYGDASLLFPARMP
ncbi:MAG: tRNA preQ1(34) S-adenosylmethionine ribosyltransferase-isomerase QueA [Hyphomicrobiales bacterium]|uniref:tRNA preQ1(34) S-adenosylmethionine ribosyltransferase-isomerase QueA n=1 Tax=Rhabdaerophilum calidifontis TaxID=2604328 RepID=UPI00123B63DC|nr:tRNA preQ1(34) S-adenosylmethionine ribosyltransferase-isomerase QueA [Rhabdaerophilum calidifontis]MCA1951394.1 tRNA preQ1(34) S-adenosylmethionine ribosyltransferase-isomerase QueA [Hyphomicrobiales bacterium]MCA1998753.1 tRNA preQ1(34) S-adenosylmethionine ribosyltransferase-isomerase QueA [Hyphomicrobiales bacterium]